MSRRSAPRSSASRPPAPRAARRSAAPASTSAASRRRRCSTPPNISTRRPTARSPRWASRSTPELDLDAMHGQRMDAVKGLTGGIEFLFKKNKVDWLKGHASFTGTDTVKVGEQDRHARRTSSSPPARRSPRCRASRSTRSVVVDSTGALELAKVPEHMVVIGGGVIGLELGSVWRRLGAKVTVRRVPRPDPARHGRRSPQGSQQDLQEAGHRIHALDQGHRRRRSRARRRR